MSQSFRAAIVNTIVAIWVLFAVAVMGAVFIPLAIDMLLGGAR